MTNKEAIEKLKDIKDFYTDGRDFSYYGDEYIGLDADDNRAINMAIKALEMQIPKEPIWEGDGYAEGEMVYDTWYCPSCDADYEDTDKHRCCPECGQAIDWSEES